MLADDVLTLVMWSRFADFPSLVLADLFAGGGPFGAGLVESQAVWKVKGKTVVVSRDESSEEENCNEGKDELHDVDEGKDKRRDGRSFIFSRYGISGRR